MNDLYRLLSKESPNHKKIVKKSNQILDQAYDKDVARVKVISLIELGDLNAALAVAADDKDLDFEKAYCHYRLDQRDQALALEPVDQAHQHLLGQVLNKEGKFAEAAALYKELSENPPRRSEEKAELAVNALAALVNAGDAKEGLRIYKKLFPKESAILKVDGYELDFNVACAALACADFHTAETHLKAALRKGEADIELYDEEDHSEMRRELDMVKVQLAVVHLALGEPEKAENLALNALAKDENKVNALAWSCLLKARANRNLLDSYKRLKLTVPAQVELTLPAQKEAFLLNKALVLVGIKKEDECKQVCRELQELVPNSALPALVEASLLFSRQKWDMCEKVLRASPHTVPCLLTLAQVYLQRKNLPAALKVLNDLGSSEIAHKPGFVATYADLLAQNGQFDKAREIFEKALKNDPKNPKMQIGLATFLAQNGSKPKAFELFRDLAQTSTDEQTSKLAWAHLFVLNNSAHTTTDNPNHNLPAPPAPNGDQVADLLKAYATVDKDVTPGIPDATAASKDQDEKAEPNRFAYKGAADLVQQDSKVLNTQPNKEMLARKLAKKKASNAKRRAKRREAHLKKLKERHGADWDPALNLPDPERWIPKNQRAKNRRKMRRGQKITGGQGAGDHVAKDSAKLDLREERRREDNKQAEPKKEPTKSKGKKKGKKKGKRR